MKGLEAKAVLCGVSEEAAGEGKTKGTAMEPELVSLPP